MTNEEAKHNLFALWMRSRSQSDKEALDMAIKALKAQLIIPSDATNGDVLKTIFGAKFIRNTLYGVVCELDGEIEFNDKWWFAPYRENESEDAE